MLGRARLLQQQQVARLSVQLGCRGCADPPHGDCCHVSSAPLLLHATEHGAEVILGVRNTAAGEKLAKEIT